MYKLCALNRINWSTNCNKSKSQSSSLYYLDVPLEVRINGFLSPIYLYMRHIRVVTHLLNIYQLLGGTSKQATCNLFISFLSQSVRTHGQSKSIFKLYLRPRFMPSLGPLPHTQRNPPSQHSFQGRAVLISKFPRVGKHSQQYLYHNLLVKIVVSL